MSGTVRRRVGNLSPGDVVLRPVITQRRTVVQRVDIDEVGDARVLLTDEETGETFVVDDVTADALFEAPAPVSTPADRLATFIAAWEQHSNTGDHVIGTETVEHGRIEITISDLKAVLAAASEGASA